MQGICLLNPINSRRAFSTATSCVIKMLVVNASDVDHVSKVFSLPYVPPLANMGDKHLSPFLLNSVHWESCMHAKKQTKANGKQKEILRLFVIKLTQYKYVPLMFTRDFS